MAIGLAGRTMLRRDDDPFPTSPSAWWALYEQDYPRLEGDQKAILNRLSQATEYFRPDEWRRDTHFAKIWLAYLDALYTFQKDEEEVRRLFKFLKNEHVGVDYPEFFMHQARFELTAGKPEKCLSILEGALKMPVLSVSDQLKKALVELRMLGTFRVDPLVGGEPVRFVTLMTPISTKETDGVAAPKMISSSIPSNIVPSHKTSSMHRVPPTPSMRDPAFPTAKGNFNLSSHNVPQQAFFQETSTLPTTKEPSLPSSAKLANRTSRLGPPKRSYSSSQASSSLLENYISNQLTDDMGEAVAKGESIKVANKANESEKSTKKAAASSVYSLNEKDLNSPIRRSTLQQRFTDPMILEKDLENMSLTVISPHSRITASATSAAAQENYEKVQRSQAMSNSSASEETTKSKFTMINTVNYRVIEFIGKGGSSRVYKVISPENKIFALKKVNLRNLDETTLNGYINEIELLLSFRDSNHIIRLIDHEICREKGYLYMLMEFGEADLGKLLKENHKRNKNSMNPDINFIRYMWQQMLQAVKVVHEANIVHCDLKPANFLLVKGTLKLIDFGISKAIMNDTTNIVRENQVGTVNYMSPEALQETHSTDIKGKIKIGRASDVWSLGCILYEMLFGKPPFAQFTLVQRLQKILDPNYSIEYGPCRDPVLLDVIQACLQRMAKHRPSLTDLLNHPFLIPPSHAPSPLPPNTTLVNKQQISEFVAKIAHGYSQPDLVRITERIFNQWRNI